MGSPEDKAIEELEAKIKHLKKSASVAPEKLPEEDRDWSTVTSMVVEYIEKKRAGEWIDDDLENYIFEAAVQCVYGDKIWDYLNKFCRR